MKVELVGGQYDGRELSVSDPPPPILVMPDLASYAEPLASSASEPPTAELRTLTYLRQYKAYTKKVVYLYERPRSS